MRFRPKTYAETKQFGSRMQLLWSLALTQLANGRDWHFNCGDKTRICCDVLCYWEWRSTRSAIRRTPTALPLSPARSAIQISSALAKSERNTNWLPAASTCCSSGSRLGWRGALIGLVRSFSPGRSPGRVLPCYTTVAAGVDRSTPIARCPPPRASSCPYPGVDGARRAYGATWRARIVCLAERDARDSDLSCVPNEKRPLSAVDAVISQRRVHLDRTDPFAAAVALWMGRHYQDVNPRRNCNHSVRRERGFNRRCKLRIMCYTGKSSRVLLVVYWSVQTKVAVSVQHLHKIQA